MSATMEKPAKKKQKLQAELSDSEEDKKNEDEEQEFSPDEDEKIVARQNDSGEAYFDLNEKGLRRCTVRSFKGKVLVDLREFYESGGKKMPGKKGISLNADQYETLKRLVQSGEIDKEIAKISK